jgi:hypothetical protein
MPAPKMNKSETMVIKREFVDALLAAIDLSGQKKVNQSAIITKFEARGISKPTLYRWAQAVFKSGAAGQAIRQGVVKRAAKAKHQAMSTEKRSTKRRLAREAKPQKPPTPRKGIGQFQPRRAFRGLLPPNLTIDEASAGVWPGSGAGRQRNGHMTVREWLENCIVTAEQVMEFARTQDGGVRNAKLLLTASEHLRRSIATACEQHEAMMNTMQIERFHEAMIDEIGKVDRPTAERIINRLQAIQSDWGP